MKNQSTSKELGHGVRVFIGCLLAHGLAVCAQETVTITAGIETSSDAHYTFRAGRGFGLVINGSDIGTILLKTCDVDQNGAVAPAELKQVTAACFQLWDTNADGNLSGTELSTALQELFPAPPMGGVRGVHVINGVAVEVPAHELPTPEAQVAKRLMAGADSDQDGVLTFQEMDAFLLGKSFSQWDQNGNGSLDAQELNAAFGQLAKPEAGNGASAEGAGSFYIAIPPPAR